MTKSPPPLMPDKNARVNSSRLISIVSFGITVVFLLATPSNPWLNLILKFIGILAAIIFILSLFLRPVHTEQALYHRVYGRFRNRFVKLYGSDLGGWRPLAIWFTIEKKPHMIASTLTLSGDEINDLKDRHQLPVNFKGTLTVKVNPEKADFEYQVELSKRSTSADALTLLHATAIVTVRKVLRDMLYQSEAELSEQENKPDLQIDIEETLFNAFDRNTYGLIIDRKQSALDKVYNKEVEAEIVRAHAARQGFDRLMEGDFSLANFARVRAAYNGSTRFRETNITRDTSGRDEALTKRQAKTPAVSTQADIRVTSQNTVVPPVIAEATQPPEALSSAERGLPAPQLDAEISNEERRLRESIERLQRRSNSD